MFFSMEYSLSEIADLYHMDVNKFYDIKKDLGIKGIEIHKDRGILFSLEDCIRIVEKAGLSADRLEELESK